MRQYVSLVLTASIIFLSQGVQASSIDDDNPSVAQGAGGTQVSTAASVVTSSTSEDLQCYRKINGHFEPLFDETGKLLDRRAQEPRSEPTMTSFEKNGKLLWTNVLSSLAHHVRVAIMEWLQDDQRGQLSLMTVSHGFRRVALVMPERYNDAVSTGNDLKTRLLTVLIGGQTGDLDLFMKDQLNNFQKPSLPDLQDAFASRHYAETLSSTREHGKTYRSIGPGDIKRGIWGVPELSLVRKNLRLVPLNFPEASRIQGLDLGENQLNVAPVVSGLTKLWHLNLSNNQLTVAPDLSGLTKLKWLYLNDNQLTVAPVVSGLTKLERLDLSKNQLITAPVLTGLPNLQYLNLSNNQITAAPDVTGLTNLWYLMLSNNQLTVAPVLSDLTNLRRLDLSNNQLTVAPVLSGLPKLEWLYLSNNKLIAAPVVTDLPKLEWLYLSNNQLTVAPVLSGLPKLKWLDLNNNQLRVAPVLSGLTKLERLYLDSYLCGDETFLETLRNLNRGRDDSHKIKFDAILKDDAGKEVKIRVSLD